MVTPWKVETVIRMMRSVSRGRWGRSMQGGVAGQEGGGMGPCERVEGGRCASHRRYITLIVETVAALAVAMRLCLCVAASYNCKLGAGGVRQENRGGSVGLSGGAPVIERF